MLQWLLLPAPSRDEPAATMALSQFLTIFGWVVGWALAIGAITLLLLRLLRRASIVVQVCLVVLATVAVLVAGMISAFNAMYISAQNLEVIWYILGTASIVAVVLALVLGLGLARYTTGLINAAHRIGLGQTVVPEKNMSSEFSKLARELQATSEKLEESRRREAAMEQARRELVSWVSHDLRTPLASMKAMTEALEDGVVTDVSDYHRKIIAQADQMAVLVNDLLELSKIQSGSLVLHTGPIDLYDLVSDSIADLAPLAAAKGITVQGHDVGSTVVNADSALISRVIQNLIVNAIRYSPEHSTVRLAASADLDGALIQVSDECGGIDEADLDRLFDMGWRKSTERSSSPYSGAGVGLSTVAGILAAHRGSVSVQNTELGCRFTVRIPKALPQ